MASVLNRFNIGIEQVSHFKMRTKGLDVKREEFLILYEIINFKTIGGATRSTSYDKARHSWKLRNRQTNLVARRLRAFIALKL